MIWPELVPIQVCHTPIRIFLNNGAQVDGSEAKTLVYSGTCNFSEQSRQVVDAERRIVLLEAKALIPGDPAPGKELHGEAEIMDMAVERNPARTYVIFRASRARNLDGTVNYTCLELI